MQQSIAYVLRRSFTFLLVALFLASTSAIAGEHGGGEGGGAGGYEKLEPFTVNLVVLQQVLQISVTLKPAKP